jgi:hypothetical protein
VVSKLQLTPTSLHLNEGKITSPLMVEERPY